MSKEKELEEIKVLRGYSVIITKDVKLYIQRIKQQAKKEVFNELEKSFKSYVIGSNLKDFEWYTVIKEKHLKK